MKIEFPKEMQDRAKRRKSKWNLLLIPLNIFFIIIISYGYYLLIKLIGDITLIHKDYIYLYKPHTIWSILLIFTIGIPSVILSFLISNGIIWLIKPARVVLENEAKSHKGTNFKSVQISFLKVLPIVVLIGLPFIYMYLNTYNALSYKGLVYKNSWYSINGVEYNIEKDLDKIKISVYKENNKKYNQSAKLSFKFIMKDGEKIEFSEGNEVDFLSKYGDFEVYLDKLLKYKVFYNIDKNALKSLLSQPRFKNEDIKKKILEIGNNIDIEYEKLKNNLEKNPEDDFIRLEFGFYEIHKNKNYREGIALYSGINDIKKIEICNDNKCLKKIDIIDYEKKVKEMFSKQYWDGNYINLVYQNFLISLIYSYIELGFI